LILLNPGWNWSGAENQYRLALKLNPNCADCHFQYGVLLAGLGRNEEAIAQTNQAIELDPLSGLYRNWLAAIAFFSRQYDLSIKLAENLSDDWAYSLGVCYAQKKMYPEAIASFEKGLTRTGRLTADLGNNNSQLRSSTAFRQRLADFPMVSEGIDDSSHTPTIGLVADGGNDGRSRSDGAVESSIRILDDHHHPHRTAAQRFWTEVQVLRRLISNPKFGFPHGKPSDQRSTLVFNAEQFAGPERCLVELDRFRPVAHREHWGYGGLLVVRDLRLISHWRLLCN
jgi:tetratricopeptide (TPR) repeat protein